MTAFQIGASLLLVILSGCHTFQSTDGFTPFDDATFMRLWAIYNRCQVNEDPGQMWGDVQRLNDAVRTIGRQEQAARLLPERIEQWLAEPPSRLAADPRAMAASCALLAGQVAQVAGHPRFAAELFGLVLSNFSPPQYAYYLAQASAGLNELVQSGRIVSHPLGRQLFVASAEPGH